MKKHFFTLLLVMLSVVTFGQQWVAIKSNTPSTFQTELLSSSENAITVKLQVPGFYTFAVTTPRGEAHVISVPKTVSTAAAGEPDLPMIAIPALIGDYQHYSVRVVEAQYTDFQLEIAPSKGDFSRQINPEDVPYTYGEAYNHDAFFPAENVSLYGPYILRDFRGQNMAVYPFAYNPVTHTLRVYYNMIVEMYADRQQGQNTLERSSNMVKMDSEFGDIYSNHFINYNEGLSKYTPVDETGELLIICHDAFMSAMQPFVNWKKQIGRPTTMVGTSTAGSTDSAIKTYIQNQYNSNSNLTHVLLVGDVAQIPGHSYNNCGNYSGKSDNWYGQVAGNDYYNELIIGRFSAEDTTQVATQVNKVINYERDIDASDTWLVNGCGIAASADSGGHYGEDDWQHINNIRTDLLNYGYSTVYQEYYNTPGYTSTTQQISDRVNSGVSIINYCNHGSYTEWQSHYPRFNNSYVNALTNDDKLPIIFSVACLNGRYDYTQPCFAEAWLRATNNSNGNPTGAIAGMFSYISQPWVPPMYGQDEMIDVLVETYSNNIKRTMGGISYDGNMKILDQYGQNGGQGLGTYMAWILYGDPTLTVRNAIPASMNVTHNSSMSSSATSFTVNATNGNGALATLTRNNEIMGSATIENGSANITFTAPGTSGTATLTVFGYNKITYVGTVNITGGGGPITYTINVSASPSEGGTVTGGGTYTEGESCTLTASPNVTYAFVNWTKDGEVVSVDTTYTFTVTETATYVAHFQLVTYTITANAEPAEGGFITGIGEYTYGQTCTLTAAPSTSYEFIGWTKDGETISTEYSINFTVTESAHYVANFQIQNFHITATANPANGGSVTGDGDYDYGESCTLEATPATGYNFVKWTKNGTQVSTNPSYTFSVTESAAFVAQFQLQSCAIFVSAYPVEGGITTGGGSYLYGDNLTVTATANEGYNFISWVEDDNMVSTEANYSFTVTGSRSLTAIFEAQTFEVKAAIDPMEAGNVIGEGTYTYGEEVVLTINRNEDYLFVNWTEDGEVVSEDMIYIFTITRDRDLVANFIYTVGLGENSIAAKVYPNPTDGEVIVECEGLSHIRIVNAFGQTVYNTAHEGEQARIDLSQMAKGIYMMHIKAESGQAVRKIVVE